ncbi:MAG TPA: hypothetical protein VGB79_10765 [Allosphingosinicella sp.]|jgi:hypothetical protein
MIRSALVLTVASSLALAGCTQTRQYADVEFAPPQGDFSLLVMRPYVSVGQIQTGGLVEPRAEWTEQARGFILEALRQQQAARGGRTEILETREGVRGMPADEVAEIERLFAAVGNAIVVHRYAGLTLPTKRRGLDWTLGQDAVRLGQATGMDYALFLHAQDSYASTGRIALQVLGIAGCLVGFCAPQIGGASQQGYASLVDLRTGEVVWFNVVRASSGDIRTREGAAQMVDRLIGRMRAGRNVRNRNDND